AAIDRVAPDPAAFAAGLAAYGESDLLCYRADGPAALVARQAEAWDPLLDWARARYDVHFAIATGVMHRPQPPATITRLADAITAR
ncbi:ATP12 family protein, partial [Acinetobacter baumannii]